MQASNIGGLRAPRRPRVAFAAALALWATGAIVYAALPEDSAARVVAATAVYLAGAAFALVCLARAIPGTRGKERLLWGLLAAGLLLVFAGDLGWDGLQGSAFAAQEVSYQHVAYLISYLLLVCAMLLLVSWTTKRIALITFLDSLSIMLSVGILVWYFFPGGMEAGSPLSWAALTVFSWPLFDTALLFLSLVVLSAAERPPFIAPLAAGFSAFVLADGWYLGVRSEDTYGLVGWPDIFWTLGFIFLGFAALRSAPMLPPPQGRIAPGWVFAFWLGPLSPPIHLGIVLVWGATHPPLPAYVGVGGAILFLYLALRAAMEAERRGERDAAWRMLDRALEASQEAEYNVSEPYDELQAADGEAPSNPSDYLRHRLKKFEEYFGIETHEDFRVPFEFLSPAEVAAAQRVFVEASWNAVKHAQARNLWLETRRLDSVVIVRIRDDGRGFDTSAPPPGLGLRYMRRRAGEAGGELDVISSPGRGTTVQIRFER